MEDEVEYKCPECGEPVDSDGDTLVDYYCSYCPVFCDTCGDHGCDQSC